MGLFSKKKASAKDSSSARSPPALERRPSIGSPQTTPRGKDGSETTVLFMNVILIDKDAAVKALTAEKMSEKNAVNGGVMPILTKIPKDNATRMVTDNKVATRVATELSESMVTSLREGGVSAQVDSKYQCGSYIVVRVEITALDTDLLMKTKGMETDPDKAKKGQKAQSVVGKLSFKDKLTRRLEGKVLDQIEDKMTEVLVNRVETKMSEKGLLLDVKVHEPAPQSEYFFFTLTKLALPGSPEYGGDMGGSGDMVGCVNGNSCVVM
eukprot:GFYU01008235.1.p1 GENE.GFYU01008235.1~~GFYU01008235.1.p1  ORF type:complete len:267 (+),score=97.75 GFYU01008235.1:145-945(+)